MLILSRLIGQAIVIGNEAQITVVVLSAEGGRVKLGVRASRDITVDREEIHKRKVIERLEKDLCPQTP